MVDRLHLSQTLTCPPFKHTNFLVPNTQTMLHLTPTWTKLEVKNYFSASWLILEGLPGCTVLIISGRFFSRKSKILSTVGQEYGLGGNFRKKLDFVKICYSSMHPSPRMVMECGSLVDTI